MDDRPPGKLSAAEQVRRLSTSFSAPAQGGALARIVARSRAAIPAEWSQVPAPVAQAAAQARHTVAARTWQFWLRASFVAMVLAPTAVVGLYMMLFASDRYVSELRFAARGTTESLTGADVLGMARMTPIITLNNNQDTYLVADFISSQPLVDSINEELDLRRMFGGPKVDFWSRLSPKANAEALLAMWREHVKVTVTVLSGLVSVAVSAYSPADAYRIAEAIRDHSEVRVNDMLDRMRDSLLDNAQAQLEASRQRLATLQDQLRILRDAQANVNPYAAAKSLTLIEGKLQGELAGLRAQIESTRASSAETPRLLVLENQAQALAKQIADLRERQTGAGSAASSAKIVNYDRVDVDHALAEADVVTSEKIVDQIRRDRNRKNVYITVVEGPTTPEISTAPDRGFFTAKVAFVGTMIWGLIMLLFIGVRDHAA